VSCTNPLTAWKVNGVLTWVCPVKGEGVVQELVLPCGGCIGCRLMQAKEWATRISHEAQLHEENCFVTLTYSPEKLPRFGSLKYQDFQLFMKRLRKACAPKKIRFFMCGEYGDTTKRAHYHAIFFGWSPSDPVYHTSKTSDIYTSKFLDDLWKHGHTYFSYFEPGAAEYIARYVTKKVTGPDAEDHYIGLDLETGDFGPRSPEFARMSRAPGIGAKWHSKYFRSDVDHRDSVVSYNGVVAKVPRYYDKLTEREFGEEYLANKKRIRVQNAKRERAKDDRSDYLLQDAKASNQRARLGQMKRDNF